MNVPIRDWIELMRREYLADFIPSGGSAVKIAMAPEKYLPEVREQVANAARSMHYLVTRVDAAQTKVHMIDWIFHAAARQVEWDGLVDRWLRLRMRENGILVDDDQPLHDMDAIALANGQLRPQLLGEINRLITNGIVKDPGLARDFRTALAMLCLGRVNPQNVLPTDAEVVKQWLLGERCNLTTLKRLGIYQKVGRHNARFLLASLSAWLPGVGIPGLVLLLDISPVVAQLPSQSNIIRYTRPGVLDTFEVLRQFIDDTDETTHFLLVVTAGPDLADVHNPRRNIDNYTALRMRVVDDVHDRSRANPLNILVHLDTAEHQAGSQTGPAESEEDGDEDRGATA